MAVTSIDVAKRAGVSQATVSRALRDQRGTSEATRQHVRAVARELGYVPLQSGRSLSTSRSRRIGIVVGELTNPFYGALVAPIVRELDTRGYLGVLLHDADIREPDSTPIFDGSFDGVLLTTTSDSRLADEIERRGIPYCLINREITGRRPISADVPDNAHGAELVADLLTELGHTDIGVVAGPATTSTGSERLRAFRDALARRGIALHPDAVREVPSTIDDGCAALRDILATRPGLTAVFCANDVLAIGALEAAAQAALAVPEQLTVIGFDDIPLARLRAFDLTTVAVDLTALARKATEHLLDRVEDPQVEPRRRVHEVRLVRRGTHAAPARRRSNTGEAP
ncbi:LacI family DNA-binding transcriptional regulator [Nocardia amikacinitolerans]|uniref:LacI family DNA-binding transcriptional regulator n=1 Tax=Nocardia amikacinitolerans TaxID=756689 RepID=UPI0020A2C32C|nr:LacI family DNA-binding transcriptional regulator [Nocardia amikacinitolerans]MCP2279678.1 transcriptional regulator, LacI family [Nocardia amikacinitolerans]